MKTCLRIATAALILAAGATHGGEPGNAPAHPTLQPLSDGELRAVTRPQPWRLTAGTRATAALALRSTSPLYGAGDSATAKLRALNLLTADIEIKDVVYNNRQNWGAAQDAAYSLPLPSTIGEMDIRNIRVGPGDNLSFGSVQIFGIDLQNTAITVTRNK